MPTPRFFAGAGVIEDSLYVVGGYPALTTNESFSPFLAVNIDIKPGDPNNVINLKSGGVVPVAILGSATFDPMTVDPTTVTLTTATDNGSGAPGGASVATRGRGVPMTATADVNHDGYPDLILYFRTQDLNFAAGSQNSAGLKPGATAAPPQERSAALQGGRDQDTQNAGLKPGATGAAKGTTMGAVLYGKTYSGTPIRGADTVRIVPPPKPAASSGRFAGRYILPRPNLR